MTIIIDVVVVDDDQSNCKVFSSIDHVLIRTPAATIAPLNGNNNQIEQIESKWK